MVMEHTILTTEQLIAPRIGSEPYEITGVGWVMIRALSRTEALRFADKQQDTLITERKMLAKAVTEPVVNEKDVAAWQAAAPAGEIHKVFQHVVGISGMREESAKDAYKSAGEES